MRKLADTPPQPPHAPRRFRFRRMALDDLDRVMDIEKDGFAHPWSAELFRRELAHDWSSILLATEVRTGMGGLDEEVILGFVIYWLVHDEVHILNIAVDVKERRRGVARELMQEASERGRRRGAVLATLEVRRSNTPALELYRSLGYRQVGIRPNYYVDEGEDAIVMVLDLV